jgi:hypothetical protein
MSQNLQGSNASTLAHNSGAIAIGGTTDLFQIVAAINYTIGGIFYNKAITNNIPWAIEPGSGLNPTAPNSFVSLAAGESCAFALFLDSAGTVTMAQGPIVPTGSLCPVPAAPAGTTSVAGAGGKAIFGAIKIATTSAAFVPDTTALTSIATYFNFSSHPGRPI